jgi:hypothetical protein
MWLPTDPLFDWMQRRWPFDGPDGFIRLGNPVANWLQRFSLRHRILGSALRSGILLVAVVGFYALRLGVAGRSIEVSATSFWVLMVILFVAMAAYFAAYDSWHIRRFGRMDQ